MQLIKSATINACLNCDSNRKLKLKSLDNGKKPDSIKVNSLKKTDE